MPTDSEAWEPEGSRLMVGERVRVRLSGECPSCDGDEDTRFVDGAIGVVGECPYGDGHEFGGGAEPYRHTHAGGHRVTVRFTPPLGSSQWGAVTGGCYAVSELERLG